MAATPQASQSQSQSQFSSMMLPAKYGEVLKKAAPLFVVAGNVINQVGPYYFKAQEFVLQVWEKLQPYRPLELGPFFFGLLMTFFGGHYLLTFAAVEAYRICGWEKTWECLLVLYADYKKVLEKNREDDQRDDNNDGIADVKQISSQELFTRKLHLLLTSINPVQVSNALSGIWMGFMAVVAVLRVQFAQTIALGASIGSVFEKAVHNTIEHALKVAIPAEYHRWIPVLVTYGCRIIGVSIAWTVQRFISAFYTAFRGSQLCLRGALHYAKFKGLVASEDIDEHSAVFCLVVGALALLGFWWQASSFFSLPFPLNIVLAPLTLVEYFLTWWVAVEK